MLGEPPQFDGFLYMGVDCVKEQGLPMRFIRAVLVHFSRRAPLTPPPSELMVGQSSRTAGQGERIRSHERYKSR